MPGINDQIKRTDADILKVQTKIKALQTKLTQLADKRKRLQERALLEKISEIAPNYEDAQTMLDLLATERPAAVENGGNAHDNEREPPRD